MNQPRQITCHCIISHPTAAKFLAIKHADGWSPPVALLSDNSSIVGQVDLVNQGMMNNYGFLTVALRRLAASPGYRCLELEMLSPRGREGLQAVWVGKDEYSQYRRSAPDQYDPIAAWLDEKEKGVIPEVRPPWERAGWFAMARDWIQQSLKRLNIHQAGPVEQYRAFRTTSSILRVPAGGSHIYFKACMNAQPAEVAMTVALAERWPQYIDKPLLADVERNWMLSWDYGSPQQVRPTYDDYPQVARMLAEIQLGSLASMPEWQRLGCNATSLNQLSEFAGNLDQLSGLLRAGGGAMALSQEELKALSGTVGQLQEASEKLASHDIPDMLVHPDLWFTNINRKAGGFSIYDWSGTRLAHPFFGLLKLIRFRELELENRMPTQGDPAGDDLLISDIVDAYLGEFRQYGTPQSLAEAMTAARDLQNLWRLYIWHEALAFVEKLSPSYQSIVRHLQRIARQMVV
jgi:hypothetical protein